MLLSRRRFLQAAGGALAGAASLGFYVRWVEPGWVEFVHRPLPIHNLPSALAGATLVQISDIHIGNRFDWGYIPRLWPEVQALDPAFVVYTGDFVSYRNEAQLAQLTQALQGAPHGRLGTLAVLGNHDYGHGWSQPAVAAQIVAVAAGAGIRTLRNEVVEIAGLNIGGIDDYWSPNFRPERVTRALPAGGANLVLCHNPDVLDEPVWHDYQGWVLTGHTHGGQVKPPFLPPPILPVRNPRYSAGHVDLGDGRHVYINRALGHMIPVRFNVRPEITVFTLTAV